MDSLAIKLILLSRTRAVSLWRSREKIVYQVEFWVYAVSGVHAPERKYCTSVTSIHVLARARRHQWISSLTVFHISRELEKQVTIWHDPTSVGFLSRNSLWWVSLQSEALQAMPCFSYLYAYLPTWWIPWPIAPGYPPLPIVLDSLARSIWLCT